MAKWGRAGRLEGGRNSDTEGGEWWTETDKEKKLLKEWQRCGE